MNEFTSKFTSILLRNSLDEFASAELAEKFEALTARMLEVNAHMNLTAITDIDGIILKHYADSLTAAKYIQSGAKLIDVGCGAGFPSLPLAIARPDISITALDSTAKRINYISETSEILGISNISAITGRAEEFAKVPEYREHFDISCARAVAKLNVLCELCIPFIKKGGNFLAMKANADGELTESEGAIKKLGGKLISSDRLNLTGNTDDDSNPRTLILIEKISPTPKNYPRNNSQISKKPL
ncbi:MAG: 16S rRNA (guanine(527)-N(7))-methyltransferase RsmG [Clostridiales bacterium]|nr:16S rRNA (guanine(527)-N(7))-methyltransferase RsmG [Clostridiales bacterium]